MTKISSFSSSFFFLNTPHVLLNVFPRAVGRGCTDGPQRLAGEALLLPLLLILSHFEDPSQGAFAVPTGLLAFSRL